MTSPNQHESWHRHRPHPWHGLAVGDDPPSEVDAFIELTPFDVIKYETDKRTGYLRVDRPQRTSSTPPTPYGFIPRTWCGSRVAALSPTSNAGDKDPLDICVLTERPVNRTEILLKARVIGGIAMIDGGEADDKIIAVMVRDAVYGKAEDLSDIPTALIDRLQHYFSTYKMVPGVPDAVTIAGTYGREHALKVIRASMEDYEEEYGSSPPVPDGA
ncbi:MAG: inorganic pyrophosphatase [Phycisphaerales bacterium]|nr:inorganic pyrophosphatase [Phycisphaerales bacterium]